MGRGILFCADRLPPLTGGMEMHAGYFLSYFSNHPDYPLVAHWKRSIQEETIGDLVTDPEVVFFNSGRWIEELYTLQERFPDSFFVYRTGGNEILKAPLERISLPDHTERQRFWVETLNNTIDCLITNSAYTEKRLRQIGINIPFFRSVGGVDISSFHSTPRSNPEGCRLFCASRFVPYKNHSLLLSLLSAVVKKGYCPHLRLAGDGPLFERAKEQVKQEGLSSFVTFLGAIANEEVRREIDQANLYIQLSSAMLTQVPGGSYVHAEGMGRSILEAISLGTFVIAGSGGALGEIVRGKRGILLDLEDFDSMIHHLEALVRNPPQKGPVYTGYSWKEIFTGYEQLFRKRACAFSS